MRKITLVVLVTMLAASVLYARGRKPDDDDADNFPDYNKLEMHPKAAKVQTPPPPEQAPAPAENKPPPSLNTPLNPSPSEDDTVPKPPPKAVPVPTGASEPPLPDDLINTLIPPVPVQSSSAVQNSNVAESSSPVENSSATAAPQK